MVSFILWVFATVRKIIFVFSGTVCINTKQDRGGGGSQEVPPVSWWSTAWIFI